MGFLSGAADVLGALAGTTEGNSQSPDIILMNPEMPTGYRVRELMSWRIPGIGYVEMYVNPKSLTISEKKGITRQRTKGGFIVQYWGEEPISLKIDGTTGSSGVEGINILRSVYRAEQDSFKMVSDKLAENIRDVQRNAQQSLAYILKDTDDSTFLPTLGSLAVSVEMYFQGWIFKGYFEDFVVTESVDNGVGVFNYSMSFVAMERKGMRNNFMPWHRSPKKADNSSSAGTPAAYNHANSNATPYSYKGEYNS